MMNNLTSECITEQHLTLFGTIIYWFAKHEALMQKTMASVSGSDATSMKLLTNGLSFQGKQHALSNLLHHKAIPINQIDQIQSFLKVLGTFTPLRDDIVHSSWVEGRPQSSIRPRWLSQGPLTAIKPQHDISGEPEKFVEHYEDQVTYTIDDLKDAVHAIDSNYQNLEAYLENTLLPLIDK